MPAKIKIPYLSIPDEPIIDSSQGFVPIAEVLDDIVIFKDGGACLVFETTSLNFGLLSENEQQAVIAAYGALLNSLSFPIQVVVRSQIKDISSYMKFLDDAQSKIKNEKLLSAMDSYKKFITETIKKRNVLSKNFYIVIPFSPFELGATKSISATAKMRGPLPFPKSYVVKKAKIALYPKRDHLIRQAGRLSIKLKQLSTADLVNLYYNIFNPQKPLTTLELMKKSKREEVQKNENQKPN